MTDPEGVPPSPLRLSNSTVLSALGTFHFISITFYLLIIINTSACCVQRYEVTFSMLEIYNEQVRDLLTKENPKGGLPVRQTPDSAFFVQGLKFVPVGSYLEISKRMEQGAK